MTSRERAVPVAMLLLVALLLRLAPALLHRYELPWVTTADSSVYLALADRLRTAGTFERAPLVPSPLESPVAPETFRTPGYPALIAVTSTLGGSRVVWLIAIQSALDVLAVLACYLLGRRLFSRRVGFMAAALAAADLPHIVYSNMIMSDVPFAACGSAAFVLTARAVASGHPALAVASGVASGVATMIRPVGALLFVPLAGYALFHSSGAPALGMPCHPGPAAGLGASLRGGRYRLAAGIVIGAVILPGAWVARNAVVADWPILSSAHYFNLYHYAASRVAARAEGVSVATALQQSQQRAAAVLAGLPPTAWSQEYARLGVSVFRRYPASTTLEALTSLGETLAMGERRNLLKIVGNQRGLDEGGGFREGPRYVGAVARFLRSAGMGDALLVSGQAIWNSLVVLAAMLGLWRLWQGGRRAEVCLLGLVCAYLAGASLMEGSGRMRVAFSPYLFILAAYGMSRWWDTRGRKGRRT